MLQLKHMKLIRDLTEVPPHEIKPIKFGYSVLYEGASAVVLAAQQVPDNMALMIARVQCYVADIDSTDAAYLVYRAIPEGNSWWILARSVTTTAIINATNPAAPGHLPLDCDEFLLFPSQWYCNLIFDPAAVPPETGTLQIRTTVFAYLVPPRVYEILGGPVDWINVQQ